MDQIQLLCDQEFRKPQWHDVAILGETERNVQRHQFFHWKIPKHSEQGGWFEIRVFRTLQVSISVHVDDEVAGNDLLALDFFYARSLHHDTNNLRHIVLSPVGWEVPINFHSSTNCYFCR